MIGVFQQVQCLHVTGRNFAWEDKNSI